MYVCLVTYMGARGCYNGSLKLSIESRSVCSVPQISNASFQHNCTLRFTRHVFQDVSPFERALRSTAPLSQKTCSALCISYEKQTKITKRTSREKWRISNGGGGGYGRSSTLTKFCSHLDARSPTK